ncbi:sensor histidine kinase [Paenibacillus eucommiae]|uniref:Sensor histidine kinase YesM n=1 Tax=Paenibacillus eucommiae TaxID=1355755 RepID=A0ABS4J073_9BACL|nr:sensor histidine kinase [Paenibacillus eucommiae]MBP1993230.1 sensor histidine kinase YesM [Paenibacillus eucommiae]
MLHNLRWRRWRLIHKLILFYMPLIVLPVVLGMYFVTSNFNGTSKGIMQQNTEDLLDLVVEKLDQEFHSFENLSLQFFVDTDLGRLLQENAPTYLQSAKLKSDLDKRVQILLGSFRPYISSAILTWGNNQYVFGRKDPHILSGEYAKFVSNIEEGEGSVSWELEASNESGKRVILLGRDINHMERFHKIAELIFVIDPDTFMRTLEETKISKNAVFELYSAGGNLILSTGKWNPSDKDKYLITEVRSHRYDWTLKTMIPLQQLHDQIERTIYISIIVTILCVLLGLGVTQLIVMDIVIPIKKLMMNMKQGVRGVEPLRLKKFRGAQEVTKLNDTFISVLLEIHQLNHEVMATQQKKQAAEVRALQNQLTPHFLYNTLNSIRWMAIIQKQDNIKEMADSLSSLLAYSIRDPGQRVTIQDEINILYDYIKIQKVRYQDFILIVDIPESFYDLHMLKFLLQPIIENAVMHGISEASRSGEIKLHAYKELNELHIVVSDNGCGMSEDRLEQIRDLLHSGKESNHLGLKNIHERIQLHYGKKYGLQIESDFDEGTRVELVLPWM